MTTPDAIEALIAEMRRCGSGDWADRLSALRTPPDQMPDELGPILAANELLQRTVNEQAATITRLQAQPDEIARLDAEIADDVLSDCTHELWERESACADGYCPLCVSTTAQRLQAEVARLTVTVADRERQIGVLRDMHQANAQEIARLTALVGTPAPSEVAAGGSVPNTGIRHSDALASVSCPCSLPAASPPAPSGWEPIAPAPKQARVLVYSTDPDDIGIL